MSTESESEVAENTNEEIQESVTSTDGEPSALGVKMGSTRTVVARERGGEVETIQDLTCLASYTDALTGEEHVLFGSDAATQYPDRVEFMLRTGLPTDDESTERARTYLREFIAANELPENSVAVYAIPSIDNEKGLERFEAGIENSRIGERQIRSYPETLCGAVPAIGDELEAIRETFLVVNLGSTNLEASAFRNGEQLVPFSTGSVTGSEVDRRIANYVEEETQGRVNIDLTTAREYKETYADFDDYQPFSDTIQQPGGGSYEFTIEDSVMDAVDEYVDDAIEEFANVFMPTLDQEHLKIRQRALQNPIVLTGGMACIPGIEDEFAQRLSVELGIDVGSVKPDSPDTAAAEGAYRIARRLVDLGSY
ncbi:MAG: rod shape-determining protein [Halanaeroarchaeum sp.]